MRAYAGSLAVVLCALACTGVRAQATGPQPLIYTCINAAGKKLTSDRLIPECNDREQRVLNSDGSLRQMIGPTLTAEERAAVEARAKDLEARRLRDAEAVRSDKNLLARFPNEAAHRKARAKALDDINNSLKVSEARLAVLAKERKPLTDEAEFYVGKTLPAKLRSQLDANDAAVDAQKVLVQNQKIEAVRIEQNFDTELERLKRLWGGAQPGSLGAIPVAAAASAAAAPPKKK